LLAADGAVGIHKQNPHRTTPRAARVVAWMPDRHIGDPITIQVAQVGDRTPKLTQVVDRPCESALGRTDFFDAFGSVQDLKLRVERRDKKAQGRDPEAKGGNELVHGEQSVREAWTDLGHGTNNPQFLLWVQRSATIAFPLAKRTARSRATQLCATQTR
jgi:hypothetical protein